MADILEKKKGKKIVSFKFTACLGRDANGKRICKCTTWKPPTGMSNVKARKQSEMKAYRTNCCSIANIRILLDFFVEPGGFWTNVFLGIFGSALVLLVLGWIFQCLLILY